MSSFQFFKNSLISGLSVKTEILLQHKIPDKHSVYRGFCVPIIPYQEQIGNYNALLHGQDREQIIPYQEQIGNYNHSDDRMTADRIIPYQEQIGNYNTE